MSRQKCKIIAICGGCDWADAFVEHVVALTDIDVGDIFEEYRDLGGYYGTLLFFREYLLECGYGRKPDENELEMFWEN